jgi:DNA helicase-2/ATP-dependent DNA helicase PcrA
MRSAWGRAGARDRFLAPISVFDDTDQISRKASMRRPGRPLDAGYFPDEEASQDVPSYAIGSRVKHRKFGSGTIADLAGSGRDAKVKVDFDDESVGRKTLVVAQAHLQRGDE